MGSGGRPGFPTGMGSSSSKELTATTRIEIDQAREAVDQFEDQALRLCQCLRDQLDELERRTEGTEPDDPPSG